VKEAGIKDLARVDHDPLNGGKVGGSSRWRRRNHRLAHSQQYLPNSQLVP
jgi:hypothetical protein